MFQAENVQAVFVCLILVNNLLLSAAVHVDTSIHTVLVHVQATIR